MRHTEHGITAMNAVNAVLFILVWTFSAVCQADKQISVSCENVTGSVGKEVNLTCSASLQCPDCSIQMYKFQYPESFNESEICKNLSSNTCEQRNDFRCCYNSTTVMTEQFRFFVQTTCGVKTTVFPVEITASSSSPPFKSEPKSKDIVVAVVVGCFILIVIIVIMMNTIIRNKKLNLTKPCGFQKRMFLCIKHEEGNSTPPEDVTQH